MHAAAQQPCSSVVQQSEPDRWSLAALVSFSSRLCCPCGRTVFALASMCVPVASAAARTPVPPLSPPASTRPSACRCRTAGPSEQRTCLLSAKREISAVRIQMHVSEHTTREIDEQVSQLRWNRTPEIVASMTMRLEKTVTRQFLFGSQKLVCYYFAPAVPRHLSSECKWMHDRIVVPLCVHASC